MEEPDDEEEVSCEHRRTTTGQGAIICVDCGLEVGKETPLEQEWTYYGHGDTRHQSNPSRCHFRKESNGRAVEKSLEAYQFPGTVTALAKNYYLQIANKTKQTKRGKTRKSLYFACVYYAYEKLGMPQCPDTLAARFGTEDDGLKKKDISRGIRFFLDNVGPEITETTVDYTTPDHLVPNIMRQLGTVRPAVIRKVQELYRTRLENRSRLINRSNPQSTAAGLVYYYYRSFGKELNRKTFSNKVNLSEITIINIAKEIARILQDEETRL